MSANVDLNDRPDYDRLLQTLADYALGYRVESPEALDTARKDGRIKPGDLVMLEAMGGGFTWGASLIRM